MQKNGKSEGNIKGLLKRRDAALQLGISFPRIKLWIYKRKIRSNRTAGGHHRIPQSEVDKDCFSEPVARPSNNAKKKSGASGASIGGQQIMSIITAHAAREMLLKRGQTAAALIKATDVRPG